MARPKSPVERVTFSVYARRDYVLAFQDLEHDRVRNPGRLTRPRMMEAVMGAVLSGHLVIDPNTEVVTCACCKTQMFPSDAALKTSVVSTVTYNAATPPPPAPLNIPLLPPAPAPAPTPPPAEPARASTPATARTDLPDLGPGQSYVDVHNPGAPVDEPETHKHINRRRYNCLQYILVHLYHRPDLAAALPPEILQSPATAVLLPNGIAHQWDPYGPAGEAQKERLARMYHSGGMNAYITGPLQQLLQVAAETFTT